MNYEIHYERLVTRGKNRSVEGYLENHHITPRCLGGEDHPDNLVKLTPEEHFVAHQLLIKLHPNKGKIAYAVLAMTMSTQYTSARKNNKLFGWLRRSIQAPRSTEIRQKISAGRKGIKFSPEHCANIAKAKIGIIPTKEALVKRSASMKGKNSERERTPEERSKMSENMKKQYAAGKRKRTPEHQAKLNLINSTRDHSVSSEVRKKISESLTGRSCPRTKEWQDKMTASLRGLKRTEEQKARMSEAQRNRPPRKPHTEETKAKMRLAALNRRAK